MKYTFNKCLTKQLINIKKESITKEQRLNEEYQAVTAWSIKLISDELADLQKFLHCPNSFIYELENKSASEYKTNQFIIKRDEEKLNYLNKLYECGKVKVTIKYNNIKIYFENSGLR